jgi:hypothetical protein
MFNTMWVEGGTTDGQNEISLGETFTLDLFNHPLLKIICKYWDETAWPGRMCNSRDISNRPKVNKE